MSWHTCTWLQLTGTLLIGISRMNYGLNKDPIPQKVSGNIPQFECCMNTFSDFLAECFGECLYMRGDDCILIKV